MLAVFELAFAPQLLGQVLIIMTCVNSVDIITTKEVNDYGCTSIVSTQDDTLSRLGQCSNAMWCTVVIINHVDIITPWSCAE